MLLLALALVGIGIYLVNRYLQQARNKLEVMNGSFRGHASLAEALKPIPISTLKTLPPKTGRPNACPNFTEMLCNESIYPSAKSILRFEFSKLLAMAAPFIFKTESWSVML